MDVLEQFLGGKVEPTAPTAQASTIPAPLRTNNPGALMPKGRMAEFGTMDEGLRALDQNLQAYGKRGVNTLRDVINQWSPPTGKGNTPQGTQNYIDHVAKVTGLKPDQKIDLSNPLVRLQLTAGITQFESGPSAIYGQPSGGAAPTAQQTGDPLEAFLTGKPSPTAVSTAGAGRGSYAGFNVEEAQAAAARQTPSDQGGTAVGRSAARLLGQGLEARRALGERVAGAIDTLYGVVPLAYGTAMQAVARTATTPERAEQIGKAAEQSISQPLGKALGITGKETYQKPLGGVTEPIVEQVIKAAKDLGLTPQQLSQRFGIPEQDIRNMMVTAGFAIPQAVREVAPAVSATGRAIQTGIVEPVQKAAAELQVVKPGQMAVAEPGVMTPGSVAQMQAQFAAKKGSVGASMVETNPFSGKITGEETVRGQFPQVKLSKTPQNVPVNEQALRAQIANEVLGTNQVRPGVVTGNENLLRNEYTLAKRPDAGPSAELLRKQIADEQVALSNYAEKRVQNTGASPTLTTPYERGQSINDFFAGSPIPGEAPSSIRTFFQREKQKMFDEAYQKIGNNPIKSSNVDALLSDPQFKSGLKLSGTESVATGAQELIDLAKTVGFKTEGGRFFEPNSIGAWDAVRKALNANWSPANAKVIRKINQAIDRDIASAGGGDMLKRADSLHQAEKTIFGSKGIKDVFGVLDSNGVETGKVSFDALPQKLNAMPFNQWKHIYDVSDKMSRGELRGPVDPKTGEPKWILPIPPELQAAAAGTKAEMLGNIAREVQQAGGAKAGVWNQNATNKILNARADKIKYGFPLPEQQAFHKLNYAGYLMPGEHGYEGAALQARRVGMIEGQLEKAGAVAGASIGGFIANAPGAAVGGYLGGKAGARGAEKLATRKAIKEAERRQKEMEKTSKLSDLIP